MDVWAGGQIQTPIGNFTGYLQALKAAGWPTVCSEGGRSGDPTFIRGMGLAYVNYNCDQCGLWKDIYTDAGTVLNLWEAYYPNEVQYITQGASSGKPNGILAGAWSNSGGDNQILANSLAGTQPSYQSIIASLLAAGRKVSDFEVWGGENSSRAENSALGFDTIVANLQKTYPPNGSTPTPTPTPPAKTVTTISEMFVISNGANTDKFVIGSDNAVWWKRNTNAWVSLGGIAYAATMPTAAYINNTLNVFVRGTDNAIYNKALTGSAWSPQWKNVEYQLQ